MYIQSVSSAVPEFELKTIYLDTARLGLMSPTAQRMHAGFARLAGDPDGLLYFADFLHRGFVAWPEAMRQRHPELSAWRGIGGLADSVRSLVCDSQGRDVLFASRSASLFQLAAQHLASRSECIATVDLLWPPYRKLLARVCRRDGVRLSITRMRHLVYGRRASPLWIAEVVSSTALRARATGLVLPALTHRGLRFPVESTVERLKEASDRLMTVVDASQAIGHTPLQSIAPWSDFLIAGAHKWLGSGQPLGIGVAKGRSWRETIGRQLTDGSLNDPLMRLFAELSGDIAARHGETALWSPLLVAQGALDDVSAADQRCGLAARLFNRRRLVRILTDRGWRVLGTPEVTRCGIILARPPVSESGAAIESFAEILRRGRVCATTYRDGVVRFSMPDRCLESADLRALDSVASTSPLGDPLDV